MPAPVRPAMEALWRLDVTFAAVLATGSDRMMSRIRLAWWREALERLDRESAPAEPLLQAIQALLLPAGIAGAELAAMEEGWALLLSDGALARDDLDLYADARGGLLFRLSARLLGEEPAVEQAGALWALTDLARHSSRADEAGLAFEAAEARKAPLKWPRRLRPLGMLAVLAQRDLRRGANGRETPGAPARMLRMARHRLTGT